MPSRIEEACEKLHFGRFLSGVISQKVAVIIFLGRREMKMLFENLRAQYPDYGLEFETYVSVPGAEISPEHEMVRAIESSHRAVTGELPQRDTVLWSSDASVLTRYGIPTVNYGPSSGPRDAEGEKVRIKTLVDITKIYALAAAELCGAE